MRLAYVGAVLVAIASVACGSAPVPAEAVTQSKASIRAAEEVGAQSVPEAALHLKMARDQVTTAEKLIADGENEDAALVLARADADAELALALAKESSLRAQAEEAKRKVEELSAGKGEAK